jgi:hypothetical protein
MIFEAHVDGGSTDIGTLIICGQRYVVRGNRNIRGIVQCCREWTVDILATPSTSGNAHVGNTNLAAETIDSLDGTSHVKRNATDRHIANGGLCHNIDRSFELGLNSSSVRDGGEKRSKQCSIKRL